MSTNQSYTRELRDNLNYTATWLPNLKLALGDVGELSGHEFTYRTNLAHLGIPFEAGRPGPAGTYNHVSSKAVSRSLKLAGRAALPGSVLTDIDAGIVFSFTSKDAIVFLATDCTIQSIADQDPLKQAILAAHRAGTWKRDYVVVTELVSAGSTSVIISKGSQGRYELKARAGVTPTFDAMNVGGDFSLAHDFQIGFNFFAQSGLTPLFRCLGLRVRLFRPDVVTRDDVVSDTPGAAPPAAEGERVTVDEVEYDDYRAGEGP